MPDSNRLGPKGVHLADSEGYGITSTLYGGKRHLDVSNSFLDSPNIDAFSRLRVSNPQSLFDAQLTYDLQPLVFEQITSGTGATITHDATNRMALMTFSSTGSGGEAFMQSYDFIRYQPGKSQLIFITFKMGAKTENCIKFAGYSDGNNGVEFQVDGNTNQLTLYSDTDHGDETVAQADWNVDVMDGSGSASNPSGLSLDVAKVQILVIDLQALYVGRVRVGFDIGGVVYFVHQFMHANLDIQPYIQTANLPIRCGMVATGDEVIISTTMNFICCSVNSEGGVDETAAYLFSQEGTVTAGSGTATHILSIQPRATFNSIVNRAKFVLESVDFVVTGNFPVSWQLVLGQALSGTTTMINVNGTYSAMDYNILGTLSGSPVIIIAQGYIASSGTVKGSLSTRVPMRYPLTLNRAGSARVNGRLTAIVTGIGGASATRCVMNWKEIR